MGAPGSQTSKAEQLCFTFDSVITPLGNGSYRVTPGRLIRPVERISIAEACRRTHYSDRQMRRIARSLKATQRGSGCKLWIPSDELERLIASKAVGEG
jgi:hypothetical protein